MIAPERFETVKRGHDSQCSTSGCFPLCGADAQNALVDQLAADVRADLVQSISDALSALARVPNKEITECEVTYLEGLAHPRESSASAELFDRVARVLARRIGVVK